MVHALQLQRIKFVPFQEKYPFVVIHTLGAGNFSLVAGFSCCGFAVLLVFVSSASLLVSGFAGFCSVTFDGTTAEALDTTSGCIC